MRRHELRHVIRAACDAIGDDQVLVMGSQAILAAWKETVVPERLSMSSEADIAAFFDPDELKADEIMGVLGQGSLFHQTHGIYADGLLSHGPRLPDGWLDRLLPLASKAATPSLTGSGQDLTRASSPRRVPGCASGKGAASTEQVAVTPTRARSDARSGPPAGDRRDQPRDPVSHHVPIREHRAVGPGEARMGLWARAGTRGVRA